MPINKDVQQVTGKDSAVKRQPMTNSSRKSYRKAPGTRIGTAIDWREGSNKSGKISARYGHALRDGR